MMFRTAKQRLFSHRKIGQVLSKAVPVWMVLLMMIAMSVVAATTLVSMNKITAISEKVSEIEDVANDTWAIRRSVSEIESDVSNAETDIYSLSRDLVGIESVVSDALSAIQAVCYYLLPSRASFLC